MLASGALFGLTSAVGVLRFPDFYSRLHPAGKGDTLAQTLILGGLLLQSADFFMAAKLVLIMLLLSVTSPTATHAISQAAYLAGFGASHPSRQAGYQPAASARPPTASMPTASMPTASMRVGDAGPPADRLASDREPAPEPQD